MSSATKIVSNIGNFETFVRIAGTYACETYVINNSEKKKLDFEM